MMRFQELYPKITVKNEDYLATVLKEVKEAGLTTVLHQEFYHLNNYGGDGWRVEIRSDFAKWSFLIIWFKNNKPVMEGGLIYYDAAQKWSVHT